MALPPDVAALATAQQRRQQRIALLLIELAGREWARLDPGDVETSWDQVVGPALFTLTSAAQLEATRGAQQYVSAAVSAQGATPDPLGSVVDEAFAGVASDGRPLATLLEQPALEVTAFQSGGMGTREALQIGQRHLERILSTQIADAARAAVCVGQAADREVRGYIRQVTPGACSRCVVLAGRFYRWSAGFDRHPNCHCVHAPATRENSLETLEPREYFDGLTRAEQDRAFTKAGAESIRLGGDISQVVNARRGALGLTPAGAHITAEEARALRNGLERGRLQSVNVFGRQHFVTTEGATVRGFAKQRLRKEVGDERASRTPRLMPESILEIAKDRDDAVRLLKRFGYII